MFNIDLSVINTNEFRREAITFENNIKKNGTGFYIDAPKGSRDFKDYWDLQEYYCTHGFTVGGIKITGEHYFYLNFCQILLKETKLQENVTKKKVSAEKIVTFPSFWDSDWYYFTECEIARNEGEHMIVLKPRRRGYSYKNAAKCAWNYTFKRKSTSLILAESKKYSEETMGMAVDYLDFLLKYTDFGKQRMHIDRRKDQVMASFEETTGDGRKIVGGRMSRIMQFTALNNPDVARGKDANVILFEEAGSFSQLISTYKITQATVQEGLNVTGQIFVYGTGGDFTGGQVDFEKMFYSPRDYGFRVYNNEYEEGKFNTQIGYFLPDYYSKGGFITDQGISKVDDAKEYILSDIERIKKTSKDPNALDSQLAEFPLIPAHAFIKVGTNIFPKAEINAQVNEINSSSALQNIGKKVILYHDPSGKLICEPNDDVKPILNFPIKKDVDGEGCILIYQEPFTGQGEIPNNLYYICCDPYAFDMSTGDSLGAVYVLKNLNPFSYPDDVIVAEYVARPKGGQDEFNKNLFALAEYYNCKIGFENDRGNTIEYARRTQQLFRLCPEFDIYDNNDNITRKLNRGFGMSMSTKEDKLQGMMYLRDWFLRPRSKENDNDQSYNLNKIYSIPLLKEALAYDPKEGNFDRISALMIGMYYRKQLSMTPIKEYEKGIYQDEFFTNMKMKFGFMPKVE